MDFSFTAEQRDFTEAVDEFLAARCTPGDVRAATDGFDARRWRDLAEMGVWGLPVPEEFGGLGGDVVDLVGAVERFGRAVLPEPAVEALTAAAVLGEAAASGADSAAATALRRIAEDGAVTLTRSPLGDHVAAAAQADLAVLPREGAWYLIPGARLRLEPQESIDPLRRLHRAEWKTDEAVLLAEGSAARRLDAVALDTGATLTSAYLLGVAGALIDQSVAYARERTQFGRPIGSFQAVKHHLADAFVAAEFARPLVWRAAYSVTRRLDTAERDVSAAKAAASDTALRVAEIALRVHGAIGYTREADLHLWLAKAWTLSRTWGGASWHRQRVAAAVVDRGETVQVP